MSRSYTYVAVAYVYNCSHMYTSVTYSCVIYALSQSIPVVLLLAVPGWFSSCSFSFPVSILSKSTAGRYRPVRVADGSITARCRFRKNAIWALCASVVSNVAFVSLLSVPHLSFVLRLGCAS